MHAADRDMVAAMTLGSLDHERHTLTPMEHAGEYIHALRRARKLTQQDLAEAVAVGRGTIERLEKGDDGVGIGTVLQVLHMLGASPSYYDGLATAKVRSLDELETRRAIITGLTVYVQTLAQIKQIPSATLRTLMPRTWANTDWSATDADMFFLYDLLLACIALDVPLIDLATIIQAPTDHAALGRQLAEERGTLERELQHVHYDGLSKMSSLPAMDALIRRITALMRMHTNLPTIVMLELVRVDIDLRRYRALLVLAMHHVQTDS